MLIRLTNGSRRWPRGVIRSILLLLAAFCVAGCSPSAPGGGTGTPAAIPSVGVSDIQGGFRVDGAGWTPLTELTLGIEPDNTASVLPVIPLDSVVTDAQGRFQLQFPWSAATGWQRNVTYYLTAVGGGQQARTPFGLTPPSVTVVSPAATPTLLVRLTATPTTAVEPATATALPPTATPVPATATPTAVPATATSLPPSATPLPPTATPTLPPAAIAIAPGQGSVATLVSVNGVAWRPGSTVYINLAAPGAAPAADVYTLATAGTDGRFSTSFNFPAETRWLSLSQVIVVAHTAGNAQRAVATFNVIRQSPTITEWKGEYYNNRALSGEPVIVRNDSSVDFDWGSGAPLAGMPVDSFAARWTRSLSFDGGDYRFYANTDDGVRVWIDNWPVIDDWSDGGRLRTGDFKGIGAGSHTVKIEYYEASGNAYAHVWWERIGPIVEWKGEYFTNPNLNGDPFLVRNDAAVDFDWGTNAPAPGIPADNFSVRWTRQIGFAPGAYRFTTRADDGIRVWVNGRRLIDEWHESSSQVYTGDIDLDGGGFPVRIDYYEAAGNARIQVSWRRIGDRQVYNPQISTYEFDLEQFVVTGSSWPPGVRVSLAIAVSRVGGNDIPDIVSDLGSVTTDASGSFLARFPKPQAVSPNLMIWATGSGETVNTPYTAGAQIPPANPIIEPLSKQPAPDAKPGGTVR